MRIVMAHRAERLASVVETLAGGLMMNELLLEPLVYMEGDLLLHSAVSIIDTMIVILLEECVLSVVRALMTEYGVQMSMRYYLVRLLHLDHDQFNILTMILLLL
jgi:hypothetical protein